MSRANLMSAVPAPRYRSYGRLDWPRDQQGGLVGWTAACVEIYHHARKSDLWEQAYRHRGGQEHSGQGQPQHQNDERAAMASYDSQRAVASRKGAPSLSWLAPVRMIGRVG